MPNKVLRSYKDKKLLDYLIERILNANMNIPICIATSKKSQDDKIFNFCLLKNIKCFRGSLDNVSKRLLDAANYYKANSFVRISGDSPLIDPDIIKKGISVFNRGDYDLVTNVFPRTYPFGQSIEIIRTSFFNKIVPKLVTRSDKEHITKYIYKNFSKFKIFNLRNKKDLTNLNFCIDNFQDFIRFKRIIDKMSGTHLNYNLSELVKLYPSNE